MPVGRRADADVADPDRAGVLALQRALVEHVAAAVRHGVVDPEPVLLVLGLVGEVDAEEVGGAAGAGVLHVADQPDEVAAEGDHDLLERRVAADDGVVLAAVHRAGRPVLHRDERDLRAVADEHGDAAGVAWRGRCGRGRRSPSRTRRPRRPAGPRRRRRRRCRPGPASPGRSSCASAATRTTVAPSLRCRVSAASRSAGSGRPLSSGSSASTRGQLDALGQVGRPGRAARRRAAPSSSARIRFIGVKRHVSSRPVGTPKASGSVEVNRSAGEPVGRGTAVRVRTRGDRAVGGRGRRARLSADAGGEELSGERVVGG